MPSPTLQDLQKFKKQPGLPGGSSATSTIPVGSKKPTIADLQRFKKAPRAIPIVPEKKGFIGTALDKNAALGSAIGSGGFGYIKGLAKGAMDTVATVPMSVNKVVAQATGLGTDKKFNDARNAIADSNNKLIDIRKNLDPSSDRYKRITKMIESGIQQLNELQGTQDEVNAELSGLQEKPEFLKPKGTAEKLGYGTEKVAEFVYGGKKLANPAEKAVLNTIKSTALPVAVKKVAGVAAGSALEGVVAGGVTAAQGGDLKDITRNTVLSALISAPFKAIGAFKAPAESYLQRSAEKKVTQALAPTTKYNKQLADKTVPEMLKRKVTFLTRGGLQNKAAENADEFGEQIGAKFDALPKDAKTTIAPIFQDLENAKSKLFIEGTTKVPQAAAAKYNAIQNIQKEILELSSEKSQTAVQEINNHIKSAMQVIDDLDSVKPIPLKNIKDAQGMTFKEAADQASLTKRGLEQFASAGKEVPEGAFHGASIGRKITEPVKATINPDGTYSILDGNHRFRQALMNGDETIPADVGNKISEVLASAKNNIIGSLKTLDMDTSAVEAIDPANYNSVKEFTKAVNEATENLTSVSSHSLRSLRQILDSVTADAKGGFGFTGTEKASLAANKAAANSIRGVLASDYPDIAALNKEFTFWSNVRDLVGDTIQRTKGQGTPMAETIAESAGAAAGYIKGGGIGNAILGATGMKLLISALKSPGWRNTSAIFRKTLADNIANGNAEKVLQMLNRVTVGVNASPSTLPQEKVDPER